MLVRTLKAHRNDWGELREKAVGDIYELPEAELAPLEGLVEPVLRQAQDERAGEEVETETDPIDGAGGEA